MNVVVCPIIFQVQAFASTAIATLNSLTTVFNGLQLCLTVTSSSATFWFIPGTENKVDTVCFEILLSKLCNTLSETLFMEALY